MSDFDYKSIDNGQRTPLLLASSLVMIYSPAILLLTDIFEVAIPIFSLICLIILRIVNELQPLSPIHPLSALLVFTVTWFTKAPSTEFLAIYLCFALLMCHFLESVFNEKRGFILFFASTLVSTTMFMSLFGYISIFTISSIILGTYAIFSNIKINDNDVALFLFSFYIGIRLMGFSITGNLFLSNIEEVDYLLKNWIIFIGSPLLGSAVFVSIKAAIIGNWGNLNQEVHQESE